MSKTHLTLSLILAVTLIASPASADWDPGDGHKMHFPQLPDPNGWDVALHSPLGDDWTCSASGPVNDIHLWVSFRGDYIDPAMYLIGTVEIWSDVPYGVDPNMPWSHPDQLLWSMSIDTSTGSSNPLRWYGSGVQGWFDPPNDPIPNDHLNYYQINLDQIDDPFYQEVGKTYWLVVDLTADEPDHLGAMEMGWKTSADHYLDSAVQKNTFGTDPAWLPLRPPYGEPLDLAFVITPEPGTLALLSLSSLAVLRRR